MDRTIGRLAKAAGVPVSTVRYYERRGLLPPAARTTSGYRLYSEQDLDRLMFIRSAQAAGFTLEDVSTLLAFRDGSPDACHVVQELIEHRIAHIEHEMASLRSSRRVLSTWLDVCKRARRTGRCGVLAGLEPHRSGPGGAA